MSDARDDISGKVGLIGKTLGRYRITAELGRGGMATVYRAFDPQLGRDVAVKVMHGAFTGRGEIERRFRREAQSVAAIKHESIVDVFDFAPGGEGEPGYIVTEIIQGPTLRALLINTGGRLLPEVAVLLAARVAGALGAAHGHGIIHRDVKPDNVMIDCRAGAPVRVVLTDFGVARIIEDDTLTATGSILGSPAYMSPEQARGHDVGKPSDVFSLGALLYQSVTGRPPFAGKDPLTVIAAILSADIQRPSQVEPHVGPQLEAVIMRCLNRDPAARYPDGAAVHAALRAVIHDSVLGAEEDPLRAFFDEREAFLRRLKTRVAEQAFASAQQCVRRGELGRALAEISRVFAYQPAHAGAEALMSRISARRRWGTVARWAAIALALAGGGAAVTRLAMHRTATAPATAETATAAAKPPLPAANPPPAVEATLAPGAPPVSPVSRAMTGDSTESRTPNRRPSPPRRPPVLARGPVTTVAPAPPGAGTVAAATAATGAPEAVGAGVPAAPPGPNTPAIAPPPAAPGNAAAASEGAATAATASLMIRASQGFCSPSLDQHPAKIRPSYEGVAAGQHQIFCTMPGGAKHLVGTYQVRPGTRPSLVVVPGPDGLPTLGRSE